MPQSQPSDSPLTELPRVQRFSAVLWPSFLLAGLATVVFFALMDPVAILDCQRVPPLSRTGAYSLGFFLFWVLTGGSSVATLYFLSSRIPPPKRIEIPEED